MKEDSTPEIIKYLDKGNFNVQSKGNTYLTSCRTCMFEIILYIYFLNTKGILLQIFKKLSEEKNGSHVPIFFVLAKKHMAPKNVINWKKEQLILINGTSLQTIYI